MARTFGDPNEIEIGDLIEIKDIQRVKLEPGDILLVRYEGILPVAEKDRIAKQVQTRLPGHEVIVMDGGLTLSVIEAGK